MKKECDSDIKVKRQNEDIDQVTPNDPILPGTAHISIMPLIAFNFCCSFKLI